MARIIVAIVALIAAVPQTAVGQSRAYAGGSVTFINQPSEDPPLGVGGTALGGSALFGVRVSNDVAIEFEPTFVPSFSSEYTYRPSPALIATVVPSRRDTFFPVQARIGHHVLEPVVGAGLVRSTISRHAMIGNAPYFDDGRTHYKLALVGGLDAAVKLAAHAFLVPTFRVFFASRGRQDTVDFLGEQTSTRPVTFRYGIGARFAF